MTFDPTTNKVPWRLLTEEERAAISAAKHGWLYYSLTGDWRDSVRPSWSGYGVYRAKPAPEEVPASVDWSHVSKDVVAIARDACDEWKMFDGVPRDESYGAWVGAVTIGYAESFASFKPGTITDWRKTLIVRPGYEEGGE